MPRLRRANAPAARARAAAERVRLQARPFRRPSCSPTDTHAEVACTVGVSRQSASRWHAAWQNGGTGALHSRAVLHHRLE